MEMFQAKENDDDNEKGEVEARELTLELMAPFFKIADSRAQAAMVSIHLFRGLPTERLLAYSPTKISWRSYPSPHGRTTGEQLHQSFRPH